MSTSTKQVHTNSIFRQDSEYDELNTEYHKYDEINSVQREDPSSDVQIALPNTAPRRANTRVCLIIIFALIAIVLTGVTTFFITKETLPKTQCEYKLVHMFNLVDCTLTLHILFDFRQDLKTLN